MPVSAPYKSMYDVSQVESGNTNMKGDQRYKSLHILDDESDSSTEVGNWDIESDEKSQQKRGGSLQKTLGKCRRLLATSLLLVIIGLLVERICRQDHSHRYEFAGDITGFALRCRHTQKADGEGI